MSDSLRVPNGATFSGTIRFTCRECEAEVEVNVDREGFDEIQCRLDEDIEDRCDECRPDYRRRLHEADAADAARKEDW